jgi:hypothetical protein
VYKNKGYKKHYCRGYLKKKEPYTFWLFLRAAGEGNVKIFVNSIAVIQFEKRR